MESIVQMDQFTYHYKPKTNQLTHINDLVDAQVFGNADDNYASVDIDNQPNNNYQYDEIGQLISDQAEGISLIEWRVDGKVKSITKTGNQPSLRFYYDGLGNRVAKKVMNDPANGAMTYYTRDAQGNTMASYKIGIANSGVIKNVLDEHTIYGSSRLGVQSYTPYDVPQDYHRLVGDKRYELSNHLGNVLNVVNDRKLVASGVETIHTDFFNTRKWIRLLNASAVISPTYSLMVTPNENNAGAQMTINLEAGKHYIFQLDVFMDDLPPNSSLTFAILDPGMNVVDSQIINSSQNINRQFFATTTGGYKVRVTINNFTGSVIAPFYLDNYYIYSMPANGQDFVSLFMPDVLAHNDYYPFGMLVPNRFESVEDYKYGFQGQEKDDEIKGEGNSLNYTFRMHDPRAGRFLSLDPLAPKYPHNSPYAFSENRVIDGVELEGLEVKIIVSDIPTGEIELRVIGAENLKEKVPSTFTVLTYALIIYDEATKEKTIHSVTRDALYINHTSKPDKNGFYSVQNIPFEPLNEDDNIYEGEERATFGSTELPAIRLRKNGSISLPAENVNSPFREKGKENTATSINIHVGGEYTTSTTPQGYVNVTGSEGCFTVVGGNEGILKLQADIDNRQLELKNKDLPTNIEIEVEKREEFDKEIKVKLE